MFNDEKYLAIEKKMNKFQYEYSGKKITDQFKTSYLSVLKEEMEKEIKNDLQTYYDDVKASAEAQIEALKKIEEEKQAEVKIDPTEELLKRQDIQMKLDLAEDKEIQDMVENYIETGEGDKTELDFLRVELRKRGLKDKKDMELELKLKVYMKEYNITEQWKNSPEYQKAIEDIALLAHVRNTGYLHIKEDEGNRLVKIGVDTNKRPSEF